jgi:hypothetical protein
MGNIAIFRQAKKSQVSTNNHLFNTQEMYNQNKKLNKNVGQENKVFYYNKDNNLVYRKFTRDGNNSALNNYFAAIEDKLDKEARADYTKHKKQQKIDNPGKKIRTVLQTKDLTKEFGIFLGGDKTVTNQADFEDKLLQTVHEILKKKGLSEKNLISLTVHYDETTPHAHIKYNDYSNLHKTTATEFGKIRYKDGLDKKQLNKLNRDNFAEFQDLVADNMGMDRGQRDSKAINRSKYEYFKDNVAIIEKITIVSDLKEELKKANTKIDDLEELLEAIKSNKVGFSDDDKQKIKKKLEQDYITKAKVDLEKQKNMITELLTKQLPNYVNYAKKLKNNKKLDFDIS